MKRIALIAAAALLTGCYTVPKEPDFSLPLNGNYKAVADCAFLKFREMGGWAKTDFDTMNKVEFSFEVEASVIGRIDIIGTGPDTTKVISYFPPAIWGKDTWPNKHRPIFQACAS